ncbi:UMP kinase [Infirmifilum lucidum]|uniref:Uridylate kinase n=1 Tax=Infirmifilum lucidum TaxID=2776706 RepID=A0A7L9FEQ3_9CREN|nr:UMP kinase [Infirmifilum lucidum]QOJ78167.1 UMP kinase [Infirmifilum lucidum]
MGSFVIKLGGSLIFDENGALKAEYLRAFVRLLRDVESRDRKIVVVVGGGAAARSYISVARDVCRNESALDQLGILASRLNASLLFTMYYDLPPVIPSSLEELVRLYHSNLPVIFTGGFQPGQSTTTVSALTAEATKSQLIIATNVDGVYTSDPRRDPNATLLRKVSIDQLLDMFSQPQKAGEYRLFDMMTLQVIKRSKINTVVVNGNPPDNIRRAMEGLSVGTTIVFP